MHACHICLSKNPKLKACILEELHKILKYYPHICLYTHM